MDESVVIQIGKHIILRTTGFNSFNPSVIAFLLRSVEDYYSLLGVSSKKQILICNTVGSPMCCATPCENLHVIKLSAQGDFWCQWVYQFAHEYCHHLVDGDLSGETAGLMWLEESFCHVSSMLCLDNFARLCAREPSLLSYASCVVNYLKKVLTKEKALVCNFSLPDLKNPNKYVTYSQDSFVKLQSFIGEKACELATQYNTDYYQYIARALYPHFFNNPKLCRIFTCLGDMRQWGSIAELYDYLKTKDKTGFASSLDELMTCLI